MKTDLVLARAELWDISIPLKTAFDAAWGTLNERRTLLLKFEDNFGKTQWSECPAFETTGYSQETLQTARETLQRSLPLYVGKAINIPRLNRHAEQSISIAAIEMGLHALLASHKNMALYAALGGTKTNLPIRVVLGDAPQNYQSKIQSLHAIGHDYFKLKISPQTDLSTLAKQLLTLPKACKVALDANGSFSQADFDLLHPLAALDLDYIEQPVAAGSGDALASFRKHFPHLQIALDEETANLAILEKILEEKGAEIVSLKPAQLGGIKKTLDCANICLKYGAKLLVGGLLETGIGRSYLVALATRKEFTLPSEISPPQTYLSHDVVMAPGLVSSRGCISPLQLPGIGVAPDPDFLDACCRQKLIFEV